MTDRFQVTLAKESTSKGNLDSSSTGNDIKPDTVQRIYPGRK